MSASPDGKLLAVDFVKGDTSFIYVIDVETGVAKRLTDAKEGEEVTPSFSGDGKRIAFACRPTNKSWPGNDNALRIVMVNVDGTERREWAPLGTTFSPVFSMDNKTIVFGSAGFYGNYSPIAQPHYHAWNFYAADSDGTNVRQITDESFYDVSPASVSPDGKSMLVVTEGLYTNRQIAIYSLDGPVQQTRSLRPHVPREADHKNPILNFPNYMPDGKSILFMDATNGRHGYDYDVYRVEIESGRLERLTQGNGYATSLRVSGDGKTAVFLKWHFNWRGTSEQSALYLLDVESHKLTPLIVSGLPD